jgi:hypothetical protein
MATERLDIRLDTERRRKLVELAHKRNTSISSLVRDLVDREYEVLVRERRFEAVRRIAAMAIEDVPDPEALSRQLDSTYDINDLH